MACYRVTFIFTFNFITCVVRSEEIKFRNQPNLCKSVTVASIGPFRKNYLNHHAESLMMAPMECRNIQEEILCVCYVCIPVRVRLYFFNVHVLNI